MLDPISRCLFFSTVLVLLLEPGIVLAHWLASKNNPHRSAIFGASTILELGSGCGLVGIVAALVAAEAPEGKACHTYFSDKKAVLPLISLNVKANCPDLQTSIIELDPWTQTPKPDVILIFEYKSNVDIMSHNFGVSNNHYQYHLRVWLKI